MGSLGESEKLGGKAASGFVASKWETVDPEEVKKGVVTTSKWETEEKDELVKARKALMGSVASKWDDREEDIDGVPMGGDSDSGEVEELDPRKDEERRALLREVEVRVMQYQDELESGRKTVKAGWTVAEQVAKDLHFSFEFIPSLVKLGGALPSQGDEEDGCRAGNAEEGAQSQRKS